MKKQGSEKQGPGARGQGKPIITAHTVKTALRELGESSSAAVADHLKVKTFQERFKVKQILAALVRTGGAKIGGPPEETMYRLTDKPGARGGVQAKLWEFACLRFATSKPFTCSEAARLAECDRDYTKRYYRWLWNSGYLASVSRGRAGALLYQVVGGKEHEPAPPWNRRGEKRKSSGQGSGIWDQKEEQKPEDPQAGMPEPLEAGAIILPEELQKFAASMRQAFADFYRGCRAMAAHFPQIEKILREMEADLGRITAGTTPAPQGAKDGDPESHHES